MRAFASACDDIAASAAKSTKVERLAVYFRSLAPDDLNAAARFASGDPLGGAGGRVGIGGSTLVSAAKAVWGVADGELSGAYRDTGDLGEALARVARRPAALGLFGETLSPAGFGAILAELASAPRTGAKRRQAVCERVLRACDDPREVAYAVKILTGDLRIGLREGLVLDAIAAAFERDAALVRRAAMASGDAGAVALAARAGDLETIAVRYGAPIAPMLASPLAFDSEYRELAAGAWLVEDKYDGIRAQAHVRDGRATLYSRTRSDVSRAFPELARALGSLGADAIVDGEIVALRDGAVLPFRYLQPRLQRIDPSSELQAEVPVAFVAFDLLAAGERFYVDEPLVERRGALGAALAAADPAVVLAPWRTLEPDASRERIAELFDAARARGNEGLVLKRTDSPYAPGRRGKWWLKLKRELTTIDCAVVAVEWGHGKRKGVLSDWTFAVRRSPEDPELLPIGKAYTGLTDAELAEMTPWFLARRTDAAAARRAIAVDPTLVVEIAFDVVQKSALHASGFSLRFPRIARMRPDKPASEIDTLGAVEAIYAAMLEREGVAP